MRLLRFQDVFRPAAFFALGLVCCSLPAQDAVKPAKDKQQGILSLLAAQEAKALPLQKKLQEAFRASDLNGAEKVCRQWIAEMPLSPEGYYNLACVHARRGKPEEAFASLGQAIERGFRNAAHLRSDPDLARLREDRRFEQLAKQAENSKAATPTRTAEPAEIRDGVALVADNNTTLDEANGLFRPLFKPAPKPGPDSPLTTLGGRAGDQVRQWWKEGTAAGHHGDLYDNRDGDHSDLDQKLFPQLARIEYATEAKTLRLHWGLPQRIFHPGVVLGNASVAWTAGPFWRSMPRLALSDARGAALLYEQYTHNQLYVYPCHLDHKPGRNGKDGDQPGGHGDAYFANTPYLIASQGSSGSDQPFLQAIALTLAALRPEVKQFLVEQGALAPTLQMLFRRSSKPVARSEDYFIGKAHPPVFRGEDVNLETMVRLAHDLTRHRLPPLASFKVIEEDKPVSGRDYFDPAPSERLFDTPCAIARVMRGAAQRRRMVLSAEASRDLNGQPLQWRWAVLRGDAEAIRIRPLNAAGSRVELSVPWHARRPIEPGSKLETNRVDIACFVGNGTHWSAPAFVTFYCPDNEERAYDAQDRIQSITYNANYADPAIVSRKLWRDEYHYADGKLTGWTRIRGDEREEFTADGRRIVARDKSGRPTATRAVRYIAKTRAAGEAPVLEQIDDEANK